MLPLVNIENISKVYYTLAEETVAIKDFSLQIYPKDFISLVGPSGCGKSTILSILAGLTDITSGKITLNSDNASIGYMLQQDHLFPWLNIYKNAILGLTVRKCVTKENTDYVRYLLKKYGLEDFLNAFPSQLSGGMRQRTALIRTLAVKPDMLLLDEPFSALDYQTRLAVSDDIGSIIKEEEITAVLVTHDLSEAISLSDKVAVMSARPSYVKNVHEINLSASGKSVFDRRRAPEFNDYYEKIYGELEINV